MPCFETYTIIAMMPTDITVRAATNFFAAAGAALVVGAFVGAGPSPVSFPK
jgi:hypothetical protein